MPRKGSFDENQDASRDKEDDGHSNLDVYLEFVVVGEVIKVIAVDADTGTEVSIMGSVRTSRTELESVALSKLRYVLGLQEGNREPEVEIEKSAKDGGKGWIA